MVGDLLADRTHEGVVLPKLVRRMLELAANGGELRFQRSDTGGEVVHGQTCAAVRMPLALGVTVSVLPAVVRGTSLAPPLTPKK
jgi:hypothetical protein